MPPGRTKRCPSRRRSRLRRDRWRAARLLRYCPSVSPQGFFAWIYDDLISAPVSPCDCDEISRLKRKAPGKDARSPSQIPPGHAGSPWFHLLEPTRDIQIFFQSSIPFNHKSLPDLLLFWLCLNLFGLAYMYILDLLTIRFPWSVISMVVYNICM